MCRLIVLLALAGVAVAGDAVAQESFAPSYQRRRGEHHGRRDAPKHRRTPLAPAPSVAAGTFQRPYPFHLDFYKQQFGGSYAPYFGNIYGPPNVVLGAPYGYPGYGPGFAPEAPFVNPNSSYDARSPWAEQSIVCPRCGEPIYFGSPPTQGPPLE